MGVVLQGRIGLVGATEHPHAARRLKDEGGAVEWITLPRDVRADFPVIVLAEDSTIPEGAFDLVVTLDPRRVEVHGGPFSGVIGAVEAELVPALRTGRALEPGRSVDRPALEHRTFWTWDHSSNWDLAQIGVQETGVFNPYGKPPAGFLRDYRAMVDFCSRHRIGAIVVYGFLRDSHGGIEAAAQLCQYANERGVRIVPGIAIGAYGGVYWEGDHPTNLATWLRSEPEHSASLHSGVGFAIDDLAFPLSFPRSDYTAAACPSDPATLAWMQDSVAWLAETFEIGGLNVESGDYGVCGCDRCVVRRGVIEGESWSHDDLVANFPPVAQAALAVRDDLWITCELQWDNLLNPDEHRHTGLPDGPIYQHTVNRGYLDRVARELTSEHVADLPYRRSALRLHLGSQWNGDDRTERYAFVAADFARAARIAHRSGMQGLTVWGEASPYTGANELNYRAFSYFGLRGERATWSEFEADVLHPLLGGKDAAHDYIAVLHALDGPRVRGALADARRVVRSRAAAACDDGDLWWRLVDRVERAIFTNPTLALQ
ncbi:MAG: hypothetical protein WBA87_11470 [Microbacterium sp.]